jgi:hypothetical protein
VVASCFEGISSVDDPFTFDGKIAQSIHVNLKKNICATVITKIAQSIHVNLKNTHLYYQIHTSQTEKTNICATVITKITKSIRVNPQTTFVLLP